MNDFDVDEKVADVLRRHPETIEVFLRHGCPDMRSGFVAFMARFVSVRNAARVHRIPLDALAADLEQCIRPMEGGDG